MKNSFKKKSVQENLHKRRKSQRLDGYDYSRPGAYFVTICTYQIENLFGTIANGNMAKNSIGEIVWEEWFHAAQVRPNVKLHQDEFVVMPNHIHGIIWIIDKKATQRVAPTDHPRGLKPRSLGSIIGQYKSITTKRINQIQNTQGMRVWQRNYYDRVIRNDKELDAIRQYIQANPENRKSDQGLPIHHLESK
jgi:REP element-mobilizing transposase RayT